MLPPEVRDRVVSYMQHQAGKPRDAMIELVRTSQLRYLDVIGALSDEAAAKKPAPDEWSVRELILHVISAEAGVSELVHHLSRGEQPSGERRPGMTMEDDGRPFASFVDELRRTNQMMLEAIQGLPASPNVTERAKHPFFGDLNCLEWAVFQRVHDEDHVQHAQKILAATA
jgi:hypothetical protein